MTTTERNVRATIAAQLYRETFARPRDPRSAAYKLGAKHAMDKHIAGLARETPFAAGTAQRDAYLAGWAEGRTIAAQAGPQ